MILGELVMRKVPDKQVALVSVAGYKTSLMSIRNLSNHVFVNMGNGIYAFVPILAFPHDVTNKYCPRLTPRKFIYHPSI